MTKMKPIKPNDPEHFLICCKALAKALIDDREGITQALFGGIKQFNGSTNGDKTELEAVLGRKCGKIRLVITKELNNS
ncbi:hypothetical protein [uncultured Haemophilus sp.]|uniref:hypothetical protein n=1 Tax=uncultured Haemophilus sp. TaxID=237779 RepID=UPI002804725B|nr:hypothetical protein [uncultured Haemophilus sp.]